MQGSIRNYEILRNNDTIRASREATTLFCEFAKVILTPWQSIYQTLKSDKTVEDLVRDRIKPNIENDILCLRQMLCYTIK